MITTPLGSCSLIIIDPISAKLIIMETTNEVLNPELYAEVSPKSVPYWIRVTVASRMATTARDWSMYATKLGAQLMLSQNLF